MCISYMFTEEYYNLYVFHLRCLSMSNYTFDVGVLLSFG